MIDLNSGEDFGVKELKIFNNGVAGIVSEVTIKVTKKTTDDNTPDYKLIFNDGNGEINEGFYYQEDDRFPNYQAQRLINLCKGVFGEDFVFPKYNTAKEALDDIMEKTAVYVKDKMFNVAVCYGTESKPKSFLEPKPWGSFIQNSELDFKKGLFLQSNDLKERIEADEESNDSSFGGSSNSANSAFESAATKKDSPWD